MAAGKSTDLMEEFLQDHQQLTHMIRDVVSHLENGDVTAARSLAQKLDHAAGPHIEFEELILYPAVEVNLGEPYKRKLIAEHRNAQAGLAQLLSASDTRLEKAEFQKQVIAALRSGLKHAESCGTLVSHLEQLSDERRVQALRKLSELKRAGRRWSKLTE